MPRSKKACARPRVQRTYDSKPRSKRKKHEAAVFERFVRKNAGPAVMAMLPGWMRRMFGKKVAT